MRRRRKTEECNGDVSGRRQRSTLEGDGESDRCGLSEAAEGDDGEVGGGTHQKVVTEGDRC